MPKAPHHSKAQKSRKRRHARHWAPPVSSPIHPSESVPDTAAPTRPVSPSLPTVSGFPHLLSDLKRIGLIAGIAFIILIVLSLLL